MKTDMAAILASRKERDEQQGEKIPRLYLRDAIEVQLEVARREGADKVYFDALAIHPEASDDCTFGDLIDMRMERSTR